MRKKKPQLYINLSFYLVGIQGVIGAMFTANSVVLFLLLTFSVFVFVIGIFLSKNRDKILDHRIGKLFKLLFWNSIFFLIFIISFQFPKTENILPHLSKYSFTNLNSNLYVFLVVFLVEIGCLAFIGLQYFSNSKMEKLKFKNENWIKTFYIFLLIGLLIYTSRNLWPPYYGDQYRVTKFISGKILVAALVVGFLYSFIGVNSAKTSSLWEKTKFYVNNLLSLFWLKRIIVFLFFFLVLSIFIKFTGLGITYDPFFWNGAGIPILFETVIFFSVSFFVFFKFQSWQAGNLPQWGSLLLAGIIFFMSVTSWSMIELPHTYFAPKPIFPNTEIFPFSDAQYFDIGARYISLGKGVNNNIVTDRPFLMVIFAFFHLLAGQEYEHIIFAQICLLALIPVGLFILGKKFESNLFGLALAVASISIGLLSISSANIISLSNPKVLMSEFPTALFLIFFCLLCILWFIEETKSRSTFFAFAAGGIAGLSIMVKGNTLVVVFAVSLFSLIVFLSRKQWGRWIKTSMALWSALILVMLPYSIQSYRISGKPFFMEKIFNVIERSYGKESKDTDSIAKMAMLDADLFWANEQSDILGEGVVFQAGNHFFHNILMSFLEFPTIPGVVPVGQLLERPYYDPVSDWISQLRWYQWGMIGINLVIISAGLSALYNKWEYIGFTPLIIFLSYHASNALARTSGGRYLVPVDWALHLYYFYGLYSIVRFLAKGTIPAKAISIERGTQLQKNNKTIWPQFTALFLVFSLLGASPVLVNLIPDQLKTFTKEEALALVDLSSKQEEISIDELETFLQSGQSAINSGLALYPRFYYAGDTDAESAYVPDMPYDYDRVYFILLADEKQVHVNLLQDQLSYKDFPNAEQVVVIGCDYGEYFDAFLVLDIESESIIAQRSPQAEFSCTP